MTSPIFPVAAIAALALPANAALVAWYDFEETSGSTITDKSGNGHNLTVEGTGANLSQAGVFGSGLALTTTSSASMTSLANIQSRTSGEISISFWAQAAAESQNFNNTLLAGYTSDGRFASTHLEWGDGNAYFDIGDSGPDDYARASGTGTSADAYHFYVINFDETSGNISVYKDDMTTAFVSGNSATAALNWAGLNFFRLGGNGAGAAAPATGNASWAGNLDDFAIFDENLTLAQRETLRVSGVQAIPEPSSSALVGLLGLGLIARRRR